MLVEGLDKSSLREVPLLESQICTNRAQIVGINSKFDAVDRIFMASEGVNELA
jgi:hypothetical protein